MEKRFRNARYQVTFVKVREEFEDDCVQTRAQSSEQGQDRSNAELMEFDGATVLLDSITAQEVMLEKNYLKHNVYGSLKELKKAICAAGKNSDDILVCLKYDGGEDNLHNLETATNRMTSAIRIMENKERELKEKREVTKSTLAAVKLEKIEAFKFSGKCRDRARFK